MTRLQRRSPDEGLTLPAAMHPLLQRVYRQRGLTGEQELDLALANLIPPHELLGMTTAVDLLVAALDHQRRVLICLLYTSPSPRDLYRSRMPSSA